jgi:hypothetical protein
MSGGVSCCPITEMLSPSPSVPVSGVPGVTVSAEAAASVTSGEVDAWGAEDCRPGRSGTRTLLLVEGTDLGRVATFTVPAGRTEPE